MNSIATAQEDSNTIRLLSSEDDPITPGLGPQDMPADDMQNLPATQPTANHRSIAAATIDMDVDEQSPETATTTSSERPESQPASSSHQAAGAGSSHQSHNEERLSVGGSERELPSSAGGSTPSLPASQNAEAPNAAGSAGVWL